MSTYPVKALEVSNDVIDALLEQGTAGVTEVANAVDVPKSTAYDHLRTLEGIGFAVNDGGTYRLSTKFLHVGKSARDGHELFVHGRDEALGLFESTEEKHVQLATEENGRCAVLLATRWRYGSHSPQGSTTPSTHVDLHTNAPGKAIMAHLEPERIETLLSEGLSAHTRQTITDEAQLRTELETIRGTGYAVDEGELISGMNGIAAPITTDDEVHGAVAVYSSTERFPDTPADTDLVEKVHDAARTIEANLIFSQE